MRRRRASESTVFLPWERRRSRLAWLSRRHTRLGVVAATVLLLGWLLYRVESHRQAVHASRAAIANTVRAIEAFRADHEGRCPSSASELLGPDEGRAPYLHRAPRDGWGHPLRITCPGRKHPASADVVSPGPSGNFDDTEQIE